MEDYAFLVDVAGVKHVDQKVVKKLKRYIDEVDEDKEDPKIELGWEKKNEYDKYAVAVGWWVADKFGIKKIGYIPKTINKMMLQLMKRDAILSVEVYKILSFKGEYNIKLAVYLNDVEEGE